jgi:hypothetical protein
LSIPPPPMYVPWNYDSNGLQRDHKIRQAWKDRELYARMVEEVERRAGVDNRLSSVLRDHEA